MKVLVTGSSGFIAKNLIIRLGELGGYQITNFDRSSSIAELETYIEETDAIIHLAGVNRPGNADEYAEVNTNLTVQICNIIAKTSRKIPIIFSSSIQANSANPYGESKLRAETVCKKLAESKNNPVTIFRLPGVFGKWCKPNYNSVVATFCHNIANDMPIMMDDPSSSIKLVYVDDVVEEFIKTLSRVPDGLALGEIHPVYETTLGILADQILAFQNSRNSLVTERVGKGLIRALYATYVSYLPPSKFTYNLPKYGDERGIFVEMLKTIDSGQFSFFTIVPSVTRGGHYHHSKTEKFLVINGEAQFSFRNIISGEKIVILTSGKIPQVVETVPGWSHDISNIGQEVLFVMLWANEIFNREQPDTFNY